MRNKYLQFGVGMIVGGLLCGTTAAAADYLTASPSTQTTASRISQNVPTQQHLRGILCKGGSDCP